jgi:hypothetical protein
MLSWTACYRLPQSVLAGAALPLLHRCSTDSWPRVHRWHSGDGSGGGAEDDRVVGGGGGVDGGPGDDDDECVHCLRPLLVGLSRHSRSKVRAGRRDGPVAGNVAQADLKRQNFCLKHV